MAGFVSWVSVFYFRVEASIFLTIIQCVLRLAVNCFVSNKHSESQRCSITIYKKVANKLTIDFTKIHCLQVGVWRYDDIRL